MSNSHPLITVGMPVYNGEKYVASAIQSVLDQSNPDFELIIADNASTDSTQQICLEFAAGDHRIRYLRNQENIGAAKNYNYLVDMARGEYFRWFNADDLCAPESHQLCLDALLENPDAVLSYGNTELIDANGATLRPYADNLHLSEDSPSDRFKRYFDQVGLTNVIYGLMRTDAVRKTELFGDGSLPGVDITFMAELCIHGKFIELPRLLFFRRMHEEASSHDLEDEDRQAEFWQAAAQPFSMPVLRKNLRLFRAAWRSGVSFGEKTRISTYLLRRMNWQRRQIAAEVSAEFGKKRKAPEKGAA